MTEEHVPTQSGDQFNIRIGGNVTGQVVAGHGNVAHVGRAATPPVDPTVATTPLPNLSGVGRIIVVVDVQGSGRLDNQQQLRMRAELFQIFRDGAAGMAQRWEDLEPSDRGDGLRLVIPPDLVPLPTVLNAYVNHVAGALREQAGIFGAALRLRLRMSIHFGFVDRTEHGWSGEPLVHAARLVDAAAARQKLADSDGTRLAVIVSDDVYRQIVRHGYAGLDPAAYQRIHVVEKEISSDAWLTLM
jgi:hypothetical protein